ncbi:MAG: hypothetical protein LBK22_01025, partial [Tannerella sp.]|nr:hypothetical protein [Tannerella sp.]
MASDTDNPVQAQAKRRGQPGVRHPPSRPNREAVQPTAVNVVKLRDKEVKAIESGIKIPFFAVVKNSKTQ